MADAFQPKFVDLVRNTTSTQGTGSFVLGPAATGFTSFTAALQPGDSFYYSAIGVDKPAEREVGRGTLLANGSISRSAIGGALTNFSNGTKTIALIAAAEWYVSAQQLIAGGSRAPAAMADRAALGAYSATTTAYLREAGREGMFVWDGSDRSASVSADSRQGLCVAGAADPTGKSGAWVRKYPSGVNVKWFGATGDGVTDDSSAFVAAVAALKAQAANYGNHYGGSAKLFIPAGHYFLGSTPLDINHTLIIEGEGSGQQGIGARGCTRLRWTAGSSGIRAQFPFTSATSAVDGAAHDGSGGITLKHLCLEGGYAGTEGDFHGLVVRKTVFCEDLYIINWQGEGVQAWAGTVNGFGVVSGDASCSRFVGVKCENNRGGFDIRGSDANVITLINCQAYTNRQFGYLDENGSGSNSVSGMHCAGNGIANDGHAATQCYHSGHTYAVKWGQEAWCSANAPSGSTSDNTGWLWVTTSAGPGADHPQWASGMTWRAGGDYVTLPSSGVDLYNCYSEGGGFSQFQGFTTIYGGTIADTYYRGGRRLRYEYDGFAIRNNSTGASNILHVDCAEGAYVGIDGRKSVLGGANVPIGSITWAEGYATFAGSAGGTFFQTVSLGVATNRCRVDPNGFHVLSGTLGYDTGAGGAVTQAGSRTAGVTLNAGCGQITLASAAGSTAWQTFTVTNNTVSGTDVIRVVQSSGTDKYIVHVTRVANGQFDITFATTGGTTTEQPVFNFAVVKAVAA
ncbi:MAG: hypothetical protein HOP91_03820 [Sphingomonas sp.]|nr:hypothetical protein [Sphingomonas sp.]